MKENSKKSKNTLIIVILALIIGGLLIFGGDYEKISKTLGHTGKKVVATVMHSEPIKSFSIQIKVSSTKESGRPWDLFPVQPDPFGQVFLDNQFFGRIEKHQDTYNFTEFFQCENLHDISEIRICLEDVDMRKNDPMGCQTFNQIRHGATVSNINYSATLLLPSKKKRKQKHIPTLQKTKSHKLGEK